MEILPRQRTFGESMMPVLTDAIGAFAKQRQASQDQALIDSFNPEDSPVTQMQKFAKLSPERQSVLSPLMTQLVKTQQQQAASTAKAAEKRAPIEGALKTISRQRELLKSGHLGSKTGTLVESPKMLHVLSGEGRKARAEYERLGKSLIGLASNLPIRNQIEFQILAEGLHDPSMTQAQIEGNLDAMELMLQNKLTPGDQEGAEAESGSELSDDVIDNLLKESGNDIKKAKAKAKKMGYKF